jgi:tetratricopeptide (TPR) repeat protein
VRLACSTHPDVSPDPRYLAAPRSTKKYASAYNNRAKTHLDIGDGQSALTDASTAVSLKVDLADAYYVRGRALEVLGRKPEAVDDYKRAIGLGQGRRAS